MQSFLNELSLPRFNTPQEVIQAFEQLGKCFQKGAQAGIKEIKIHSTFYAHEFAPNYFFINLLDDHNIDADLKTMLKGAVGIVPYIDEILDKYETDNQMALGMSIGNVKCIGLGLSSEAIFNTITFSYHSNNFDGLYYEVNIDTISEDEDSKLSQTIQISIARNIAAIEDAEEHTPFISHQITSQIEDGKELWLRRAEIFPNLQFCNSVKSQLSKYHYNTLGFHQILVRLLSLQETAFNFDGTPVKPEDFPTLTSRESATRLRDFKNELTILCPDGSYRLFDWHSRFTPGAGRIHFYPIETDKIILIGSIANQNSIK